MQILTILYYIYVCIYIYIYIYIFVLIEQITKKYNTIEELRLILKRGDNFWILNLCTRYPDGLNQELIDV